MPSVIWYSFVKTRAYEWWGSCASNYHEFIDGIYLMFITLALNIYIYVYIYIIEFSIVEQCHNGVISKFIYWECRTDSRFVPSQYETSLQSNAVSHWLGTNLESALQCMTNNTVPKCIVCWYGVESEWYPPSLQLILLCTTEEIQGHSSLNIHV